MNLDDFAPPDQSLESFAPPDSPVNVTGDNCGDALAKYLNTTYGYKLPRGGIGPGEIKSLGESKGAPVYSRNNLSPDALTPGTIIHMTRQKGDKNYEYGPTHIGIVDQGDSGPVFRSFTKGKGWREEPVNDNFINNLPSSIVATNVIKPESKGVLAGIGDMLSPSSAEAASGEIDLSQFAPPNKEPEVAASPVTPELGGYTTARDPGIMSLGKELGTPLEKLRRKIADDITESANTPFGQDPATQVTRKILNWPIENITEPLIGNRVENFLQSVSTDPESTKDASIFIKDIVSGTAAVPLFSGAAKLIGRVGSLGKGTPGSLTTTKTVEPSAEALKAAVNLEGTIPGIADLEKGIKLGNFDVYKELQGLKGQGARSAEWGKLATGLGKPAEVLTPEAASRIQTLEGYLGARAQSLERLAQERETTQAIIDNLRRPVTKTETVQLQKMYGGGPDTEEVLRYVHENATKGASLQAIINTAAKAFGSTPQEIHSIIRGTAQINAGGLGNKAQDSINTVSKVFDTVNQPLAAAHNAEFKQSLPSVRDVGIEVPPPPNHPGGINPEGPIFPKKDLGGSAEFVSPTNVSGNLFGKDGPIHEWMSSWHKTLFDQTYYRRFVNNIFKDAGLMDDVKQSVQTGEKVIGPISRELEAVTQDFMAAQGALAQQKRLLTQVETGSPKAQQVMAEIQRLEGIKLDKNLVGQLYAKLEATIGELEKVHPNVRIARAADGNAESWSLLNPKEHEVATKLQQFYKQFGTQLAEQGVPTIKGTYTNHVYHWAGYDTDQGLKAFANKLWYGEQPKTPDILKFLSREPGAKDWFPFAYQKADAYVGAASRKLAFNPWYEKWSPAIAQWKSGGQYGNTANWLEDFLGRNMTVNNADTLDKIANSFTNFEYAHYLLGNFSPALLHLFKITGIPAWHGFGAATKGLGQYGEALGGKMVGGLPNQAQRAMEYYVLSPQLIQSLEQSPAWAGTFQPTFWQKLRGYNPTRLTEHFGRGINALSSIAAGEKAGASTKVIHNATLDALARLDFFGWDAPPAIAKHRMLAMFQQQPQKLMEMKGQLIVDALRGEKDYYGNSHWPKLVRLATILGGLYEAGELAGFDLSKHIGAHIPFFPELGHDILRVVESGDIEKISAKSFTPAVPPTVQLLAGLGGMKAEDTLKNYLSYGGTPQKLLQERIPEKFDDNRLQWLLGVPKAGHKDEQEAKGKAIEAMQMKRSLKRGARTAEDVTPYNLLLEMMRD